MAALATAVAGIALAPQGASAVELVDEIPVAPSFLYTVTPDGTVWQTSAGATTIVELSPDDGSVIDSFEHGYSTNWGPKSLAYQGGRVYAIDGLSPMRLVSWDAESADTTDPGRVTSDNETNNRLGTNQAILRAESNGAGAVALGQSNKAATFNLTDLDAENPYYPHSIFGAGISDPNGVQTAFQACAYSGGGVIVGEPDNDCGIYIGRTGGDVGQLNYVIDTAFGDGGIYVLEANDNEVTFISLSGDGCPCASFDWSLPGGPSGGSYGPSSMRVAPDTGHLLISSSGHRRIDEFTTAGNYVRSFGFGVRTGQDQLETCGGGAGACQTGLSRGTNFTRLDIANGHLYAGTVGTSSIQVISLDDNPRVDLKAKPRRVKKGDKTTLTATLSPCEPDDQAQFQVKAGQGFDDLGSAKAFDGGCQAKKKVKVNKQSVFRAVASDSGGATIATSPTVTVKLK